METLKCTFVSFLGLRRMFICELVLRQSSNGRQDILLKHFELSDIQSRISPLLVSHFDLNQLSAAVKRSSAPSQLRKRSGDFGYAASGAMRFQGHAILARLEAGRRDLDSQLSSIAAFTKYLQAQINIDWQLFDMYVDSIYKLFYQPRVAQSKIQFLLLDLISFYDLAWSQGTRGSESAVKMPTSNKVLVFDPAVDLKTLNIDNYYLFTQSFLEAVQAFGFQTIVAENDEAPDCLDPSLPIDEQVQIFRLLDKESEGEGAVFIKPNVNRLVSAEATRPHFSSGQLLPLERATVTKRGSARFEASAEHRFEALKRVFCVGKQNHDECSDKKKRKQDDSQVKGHF